MPRSCKNIADSRWAGTFVFNVFFCFSSLSPWAVDGALAYVHFNAFVLFVKLAHRYAALEHWIKWEIPAEDAQPPLEGFGARWHSNTRRGVRLYDNWPPQGWTRSATWKSILLNEAFGAFAYLNLHSRFCTKWIYRSQALYGLALVSRFPLLEASFKSYSSIKETRVLKFLPLTILIDVGNLREKIPNAFIDFGCRKLNNLIFVLTKALCQSKWKRYSRALRLQHWSI